MAFQVVIDVQDDGRLSVASPAPPPLALKVLREAVTLIHDQVIVSTVLTMLEHQQRVAIAPASALTQIARAGPGNGAPS